MNRKDRRAAGKQGKGPIGPAGRFGPQPVVGPRGLSASLLAAAIEHLRAGRLGEAEKCCRDVLTADPGHFDALHLLGIIAFQVGRYDASVELIGRALAVEDRHAVAHFNLGQALRVLGRFNDATTHLTQAAALKRDYSDAHIALGDVLVQTERPAEAVSRYRQALVHAPQALAAHYGLANALMQQGDLDVAAQHYRRVLSLKPDFAEACNNLGIVLAAKGERAEAATHYQRALTLKPDLVDVYRNFGRMLLAQGDAPEALALARHGLTVKETEEARAFFVQCAKHAPSRTADSEFVALIARALSEGWSRPSELAPLAADIFKQSAVGAACIARAVGAWPGPLSGPELWGPDGLAAVARDPLLRALLESAPVRDVALERFLTAARSILLETVTAANAAFADDGETIKFFCALGRQCFINEYVFAVGDGEPTKVQKLRTVIDSAIASGADIPVLAIAALAAYEPLHTLSSLQSLLERSWPPVIRALLDQQVREPLAERALRSSIPALTPIEDAVSVAVREQYEDMPYPRWVRATPVGKPTTLAWYLRSQFPAAPFRNLDNGGSLDILIAGCGTGQHSIETSRRFAGARVLAIDLSLTSLSYARRNTQALGLTNIHYAQADILRLGSLGQTFDLIESSGVLHHLQDPAEGWRVLLSLLRPGGFMHIGLYSALARSDIRTARDFIAQRGYGRSAQDIRRCRQEILALDADATLRNVTKFSDFFTTSECRDHLFHVQEHQFTIPQIKSFLADNNLTFIGFAGDPARAYRVRYPDDKAMADLDRWHELEIENPYLFVGMYQFWVQKAR